ncbi:MAG: hypothetical protein ACOY3L_03465 [Pseudomonadota bacterium]
MVLMSENAFQSNVMSHAAAIRLCLDNHLHTPALVLIYSGVDFMAALCRPENQAEVNRCDFISWAEIYMKCQHRLGVSGLDLYAARCGLLHTYTPDSKLSEQGRARPLFYSWGNKMPHEPTMLLRHLGFSEVMIKIETLFEAYAEGVAAFTEAMDRDAVLKDLVLKRSKKLFVNRPTFP